MFAKRKRGIISLLLALFMLLSPIQALFAENAEGNTSYGEQAQDLKDIGEGSDHLTESEQANPAPIIEDNKPDPYLGDIAPKGLRSRGTQLRTPNPGAVELSKTVEAVPGKLNTFKVTLRMEATDREQKNDIVLVIDTSGSMKDNGRMEKAKEAAISFVNRLLDAEHPNTRIALVSFESKAYLKKNFTNYTNKQALINAINALKANGGTFTQGGIKQAEDLLSGSQADFKNIVLLSDGVPTFNYAIDKPDNYLVDGGPGKHTYEKQTGPNVPKSAFLYNVTYGAGNSMWWKYWDGLKNWKHYYHYYNSGNCAIAEASFAKNSSTLYTVAVEAGNQGDSVLNQMASPNCAYTANPAQLTQIFNQIAARIASAMKNANVTDPMGAGFEVKGGNASNVQVSQGSVTLNNNTISWNVGTLTESVPGNPLTRFAEMTYEVEVNDSILGVVSASGQYNTNAGAQVSYIDIDGNQKTKNFPEPTAEPLLIGFYKQVLDSQGKPVPASELGTRKFTYNMKLNEDGSNKDYTVAPGTPRVMTDLRIDKGYTFKETAVSGNPASQLSDYETSVKWETFNGAQSIQPVSGTTLNNFVVPKDANNKPLNTRITVTNKEKADGKLTIEKKLNTDWPLPRSAARGATRGSNIPAEFKFTVKGVGYDGSTVVYENNDVRVAPNQSVTLENLPYGTYTVTEVDVAGSYVARDFNPFYTVENENATGSDSAGNTFGTVKISIDKKNRTMTVINTPMSGDAGTEFWAIKKWSGGPAADHGRVNWELYADGVLLKDNENNPLKPNEIKDNPDVPTGFAGGQQTTQHMDGATAYVWKDLKKYNKDGSPIVYTVKEAGETADHKITVNGNEYSVSYGEKKDISYKDNDGIYHNYITQEVTNAYIQPTNGEVTVTKVWKDPDGKTLPKPEVNLTLYRKVEGGAEEQVPIAEAEVKVVDGTTTTAKWENLKTTDKDGKTYSFIVKESFKNAGHVNNDNWTLVSSTDVVNGAATIKNEALVSEADLGKLTVTKKPLVNGQGVRGPVGQRGTPLKFSFKVTGPAGYEETFELAATESKVLTGLYFGEYKVEETNTQGYTPSYAPGQTVTLRASAKTATIEVTNTNGGEGTVVDKTVEKVWVNGPKPSVTIELWRKNNVEGADKIDEKVDEFVVPANASGDALKKTFTKLAKHDSKGNEFEYYVKEETVPANYTKAIDGLKVTNTYTQPTNGEVTVTKVWQDPDGKTLPKPEVNLTLYRKVEGGAEEQVPIAEAEVKVVDGTTTTAKWENLKTTDKDGKTYSFIVKESFKNAGHVNNDNWTLVSSTDVVNGAATIKNEALVSEADLGKLTVTKKPLVNGQGVRGPVGQRGTPLKFSFKVTGPAGYEETFELAATESKVLTGLYFGEYKVEETNTQGYTPSYAPGQTVTLRASAKTATIEVTNTNGGEGTVVDKTVEKVWVNGPKPSVTIELWRKNNVEGADKIDEKVDEFVVPENASGDALKKTFTKLAKHDPKGNEYEYYVKEDNVPANYTKSIEGLKVTNTYTQPSDGEVTVTKVWQDPDGKTLPKPEINLTLYRNVEGGAEEQVPAAEAAVKVVDGTTTTAKWTGLKTTDINGNAYSFIVKESFKNAGDVNNDNWTLVASTDVVNGAATIKNEALVSEADLGKLTVTKKPLVNGQGVRGPVGQRGTPLKFSFKVTGPAGYEETFELAATESKVLTGLYFGEYKVEETNTQGYTPSYAPGQTVTLRASAKTATIEVTNTNGGDGTVVDKTVEKVWVNGPKPDTVIQLWRKGTAADGTAIDEKVGEFTANGTKTEETFTNLAKHDPKGNEFEYYVKEDNVPANYTKNIDGLKVTNTYTQPQGEDIIATKTWENAEAIKPEIKFELWRKNGTAGDGEKVVDAKALVGDTVNFGKQLKTDINGVAYTYFVKEVFTKPEERDNWIITGEGEGLTVNNKLKAEAERDGKLNLVKLLKNEAPQLVSVIKSSRGGSQLEFVFKVTGPYGFVREIKLKAGESITLENLSYGQYKVEETNSQGFAASYDPANGEVMLTSANRVATVTVTNTNDGGNVENVTPKIIKIWVNGPKPATKLELWRRNNVEGAGAIDEKVNEFITTAGENSQKEFTLTSANIPLAKFDPNGYEFEYYAKEPNVPADYMVNVEGLKVTNTYKGSSSQNKPIPKTGDSYTSLPLVLVIVSMLSLAGVTVLKKKRLQK